jgi:DNA-binding transcriptional LysR family regulator
MEERLLKFAKLVDAGNFTKAAASMHLSQPALTTAVQKLERELKAELLVRGSRGLRLTDAGQVAYSAAKDLTIRSANLRQQITELTHEHVDLHIGMIDSLADKLIANQKAFATLRSQAHVALSIDGSARLLLALDHDKLDIAFMVWQSSGVPHGVDDRLALGNEPLIVVTSPRAQAAASAAKTRILQNFLSYNQTSTTYQLIHTALMEGGWEPVNSFYSTSPDILLKLTLAGEGIAALPYHMVVSHLRSGALVRVDGIGTINRPIVAAVRRGKRLTPALIQLCEHMRTMLHEEQQSV